MIKQELRVHELDNSQIIFEEYKTVKAKKSLTEYIERYTTADVGQVKMYLGFLYFIILLFFSIALFF